MGLAVEQLEQSIDELAALDVDALTDDELHDHAVALQRLADRLTAATAPVLERWDSRQVWAGDGSKSAAARLARETSSAKRTTAAVLRRARALRSMPVTAAAARAGELSIDHVDLLAGVNTPARRDLFTEHEQMLVDLIRDARYLPACHTVAYWRRRADTALGLDDTSAERHAADTHLHASETIDGLVAIDGLLDPVSGAIVTGELDRLIDELRRADAASGVERTLPQLRAAALVEMARRSAAMPQGARTPKPLFTVLLGDKSFEHLCELANGVVITPQHLVPWLTDAMFETILFDGPTTVVSVSKKRSFAGALRRAIEARDRHCQHPSGCDEPANRCDVDHIQPYSQGGPTSQFNGRLECHVHNRNPAKHDHDAMGRPGRPITRLDELRTVIRWRQRRYHPDEVLPDHEWPHTVRPAS